jgi:hypothetical protein
MRFALVGLVTIAATLTTGVESGSGQESFFNEQFCTRGGHDNLLDCGYNTWQQCIATARGLARYCVVNPFWPGRQQQPTTQSKSHQYNR